jgi:predicted nucleic acid-binding protein
MARIIVLDSGPLGLACRKRGKPDVDAITFWSITAVSNTALIVIPEIADYEVRRALIRAGAKDGLKRLDALRDRTGFLFAPILTPVMVKAAELWADVRSKGLPTSDAGGLDGDAILAAQALHVAGRGDELVVATDNVKHLVRFGVDAREWSRFTP